jgi:CheY-like chemotaxis protein
VIALEDKEIYNEVDTMTLTREIPPTVLVVDDEPILLMETSAQLEDAGYRVIEACNGPEALRLLEGSTLVDIVCTDVRMPGTPDGIALAKWIKDNRPELPVLSRLVGLSRCPDLPTPFSASR